MTLLDLLILYMFAVAYHELAHGIAAKYYGVFHSVVLIRKPGILGLVFNGIGIGTSNPDRARDRYVMALAPLTLAVPGALAWPFSKAVSLVWLGAAALTISDVLSLMLNQQESSKWKYTIVYPRGIEA